MLCSYFFIDIYVDPSELLLMLQCREERRSLSIVSKAQQSQVEQNKIVQYRRVWIRSECNKTAAVCCMCSLRIFDGSNH